MCRTKRKFKKMQFFISKINVQCLRIFFIVHLVDIFKQFFSKPYWELNSSKNDNQGLPGISLSFEIVAATHFLYMEFFYNTRFTCWWRCILLVTSKFGPLCYVMICWNQKALIFISSSRHVRPKKWGSAFLNHQSITNIHF